VVRNWDYSIRKVQWNVRSHIFDWQSYVKKNFANILLQNATVQGISGTGSLRIGAAFFVSTCQTWFCYTRHKIYDDLMLNMIIFFLKQQLVCSVHVWYLMATFIINNLIDLINPSETLRTFKIKSRSARTHLRKIWLHGQIFISHTYDACDVSIPTANSECPIIATEVLWDIMT